MKKCPFCSEEIQNEAIKCKHCGSDLTGKKPKPAEVVVKKKTSGCVWAIIILIVIFILPAVILTNLAKNRKSNQAPAEQSQLEKKQQDEQAKADPAWQKTKAGKICSNHTEWSKEDCDKLANNKIWVGMTYDMLVATQGKPDSANPSNYGSGNKMQYCWNGHTPNCFYDDNGDGVIDAYN